MQAVIGKDISQAADLLSQGRLVGIPTETVYGLAGNALNAAAVTQIFRVKERPAFDPLIMHFSGLDRVEEYVSGITEAARTLAHTFWPGPVTMVFPRRAKVPDLVTSGLDSVAVRIPSHPLTRELLTTLAFPLAAPSANPFGYISPTAAQHVVQQLGQKIPYVLDGGSCRVGLESTIVSFVDVTPVVLRKGGIALEEIFECLGQEVPVKTHSSSNPVAPGMLARHYSPTVPFFLASNYSRQEREQTERIARITFGTPSGGKSEPTNTDQRDIYNLSTRGDLGEAARRLFSLLRELDTANYDVIIADLLPETGLGRAINDRLRRAAAGTS